MSQSMVELEYYFWFPRKLKQWRVITREANFRAIISNPLLRLNVKKSMRNKTLAIAASTKCTVDHTSAVTNTLLQDGKIYFRNSLFPMCARLYKETDNI